MEIWVYVYSIKIRLAASFLTMFYATGNRRDLLQVAYDTMTPRQYAADRIYALLAEAAQVRKGRPLPEGFAPRVDPELTALSKAGFTGLSL